MKKYLLFATTLLATTFLFGQSTQWGSWNKVDCYKGISFRCKLKDYNSSAKQYHWEYEIKNSYSQKVALTFDIANTSGDGRMVINAGGVDKSWCLAPTNSILYFTFSKLCFYFPNGFDQCSEYPSKNYAGFAECDNGIPKYVKAGNNNNNNNSNQNSSSNNSNISSSNQGNTITHQQNDPTFDRNNASYQDYYKKATAAGQAGNYDEAISLWNSAISVAVNDVQRENAQAWLAEAQKAKTNATNNNIQKQQEQQRQQQEQQRQQQLQQGINQLATSTSDLITFLASRKKASKSALSKEDGQILLGIVNSESPFDYTQNIIDIFSDLGYTLKETSKSSDGSLTISMFDNSTIQWPLYIHIYLPSKYNDYNRISFSYQRKKVLINQLWVINDNLVEGWNLKGLSPSKQKEIEEKNIEKNKKKLEEESKALEKESIAKDNKRKIDEITPIKTDKIIDSSITVQSILNNCILAMGGEDKLKAVVSVTKYCENEVMSYYTIQTFGKYAYTGSYKGKSSKLVFDGINGYNEYDGKKSVLTENLISIYKKSQPFEILELKARNDLKIGSIETIGNKEYITIIAPPRIINGDSYSDKLYFDIVNGLYLGTSTFYSYKSFTGSYKNIVSYNFYYDYKEINKIKFPFTNITTSGDTYYTKTIITKIMLNEPLTDNDFK